MPLILLFILFFSSEAFPVELKEFKNNAYFSGRISRINKDAGLIRLRVDFENLKFINYKDRIEFWNEKNIAKKCIAYVEGRSNRYLLLKIPSFKSCILGVGFTTGSYLRFYSEDLEKSLKIAESLMEVLMKKELALKARENRLRRDLDAYVDKVDVVNKRYEVLRQKLEIEWEKELSLIEEDKIQLSSEYHETKATLEDIELKIRQYRIQDHNFVEDRWSLDPNLYIKK